MPPALAAPTPRPLVRSRANDRFKSGWNVWLAGSIVLAFVLHAGVLLLWPAIEAPYHLSSRGEAPRIVAVSAPGVENVAPAPKEILVPEMPTVEDLAIVLPDERIGPLPTFADPVLDESITPPVYTIRDEWLDYQSFAPFLIAPAIRNQTEMKRFLQRHYQPILEFSGAQGVVQVHFWIDEAGGVARAEVAESSGSRSLDRLAMRLSRILRFSPALRLGQPVRVLVRLPITFRQT